MKEAPRRIKLSVSIAFEISFNGFYGKRKIWQFGFILLKSYCVSCLFAGIVVFVHISDAFYGTRIFYIFLWTYGRKNVCFCVCGEGVMECPMWFLCFCIYAQEKIAWFSFTKLSAAVCAFTGTVIHCDFFSVNEEEKNNAFLTFTFMG